MSIDKTTAKQAIAAAQQLSNAVNAFSFAPPVTYTYNPLDYAWAGHEAYLRRFADGAKKVLFIGMNPGPFGMVQTGVPFGEVAAVRDWLNIDVAIQKPKVENPKRPIEGFSCQRSEVSGRRLWGLFAERFGSPKAFFADHFVVNYCPLAFFNLGRNITPDKLPARELQLLLEVCDRHLMMLIDLFQPQWLIGIGAWAEKRAQEILLKTPTKIPRQTAIRIGRILHPSPASPAANRGWSDAATRQLQALSIW